VIPYSRSSLAIAGILDQTPPAEGQAASSPGPGAEAGAVLPRRLLAAAGDFARPDAVKPGKGKTIACGNRAVLATIPLDVLRS
jgi:hypothetical protein